VKEISSIYVVCKRLIEVNEVWRLKIKINEVWGVNVTSLKFNYFLKYFSNL
jgi:hypothetical protein